jgi:hypothetical protein
MNNFVLFCGASYVGKTAITDELLAQAAPITLISNDKLRDEMFSDIDLFEELAKETNLYDRLKEVIILSHRIDAKDFSSLFAAAIPDILVRQDIKYQLLTAQTIPLIINAEQTPLVEGNYVNAIARKIAADSYRKDFARHGFDFDRVEKQMIYVDVPIEIALDRFDNGTREKILSREMIEKLHAQWKQPPSILEWANTSVYYIDGSQDPRISAEQVMDILNENN